MAHCHAHHLAPGGADSSGSDVVCIYAKNPPDYVVYRNPMRVMVHFSDNDRIARRQRAQLAALNPLRGQISGLIDGWHSSDKPHEQSRAARYDRRVADAIIVGLEGSSADALALLTEIRHDIIAERKSLAQTDYLMVAALSGIMFLLIVAVLSSPLLSPLKDSAANASVIWTGAAGGTLGAFFSVAIGLRSRTILVDLQKWDNRRDAILRMAVGTIGGAILICLFLTGQFTVGDIGKATFAGEDQIITALVMGFLAGFSERAVPDLLAKSSFAPDQEAKPDAAVDQPKAANAAGAAAAAGGAAGAAAEDEDDGAETPENLAELDLDSCLCDSPPVAGEELTEDKDLPVAVGGVSADLPAAVEDAGGPPPPPPPPPPGNGRGAQPPLQE